MKKLIIFILTLLLTISLISCSSNKKTYEPPYDSLIADSANGGISQNAEIDYWSCDYFQKILMPNKSYTISGKKYSGKYTQSITDFMDSFTTDIYYNEDDGIEFGLRADNGELAYINFSGRNFYDTQILLPDTENPEEDAISLATEVASEYINIEDYTQINEEPRIYDREIDGKTYTIVFYVTTFAKKINDCFTSDFISVKVTSKGALASIKLGDINAFEGVEIDFDIDIINQSVHDKIESMYTDIYELENVSIIDQKLVLTPKKEIGMLSSVKIEYSENDNSWTSGNRIITIIGKK